MATLAAFSTVGVDPRLYSLIYGESILNDAVAIVFFSVFKSVAETGGGGDEGNARMAVSVIWTFIKISIGSTIVGALIGAGVTLFFRLYGEPPMTIEQEKALEESTGIKGDVDGDGIVNEGEPPFPV